MLADAGHARPGDRALPRARAARLPREPRSAVRAGERARRRGPRGRGRSGRTPAAIKLRPTGELLARAYLGLGSSRCATWAGTRRRWRSSRREPPLPEHAPLRAFLALATADTGKPREAVIALVEDLLEHHDMGAYTEPLRRAPAQLQRAPRR